MVQRQITIAASFAPGTIITRGGQRFRAVASSREGGTIFSAVREASFVGGRPAVSFERADVLARTRRAAILRTSREFKPTTIRRVRVETPDVTRVKTLFSASLSPKVRSILSFEAAGGGLEGARLQRFESLKAALAREKVNLDRQNRTLETQQNSLSKAVSAFNQDQQRLQRLANAGLLLPGVAKKNELKGKKLNESVTSLNKRVDKANASADTFNKGVQAINRTERIANVMVGKKVTEVKSQPIARFEAAPTKRVIREELQFPVERVIPTDVEFARRTQERARGFEQLVTRVAPPLSFLGQLGVLRPTGELVGAATEVFETGLRGVGFGVETGIGGIEQVTGEPFGLTFRVPRETARLISGFETIPIVGPAFRGVGLRTITPTASELLFGKQQVVRGAVAATELELLLGFPVTRLGFRAARGIGVSAQPPITARVPSPDELVVQQLLGRRTRTLPQIEQLFAGVQRQATEKELAELLTGSKPGLPSFVTRPLPPTRRAREFGRPPRITPKTPEQILREIIPPPLIGKRKPRRTIVIRFPDEIGEAGTFLPGRPRRRPGRTIQIPRPTFLDPILLPRRTVRVRQARVVRLQDLLREPQIPRVPRIATVPLTLGLAAAAGRALTSKELESTIGISREALRQFQRTATLQRVSESQAAREATRFRSLLGVRSAQQTRALQRQRAREAELTRAILFRPTRAIAIGRLAARAIVRTPRVARAPRIPPILPPLPFPTFDSLLGRPIPRRQGFRVRVKSGKTFRTITKKPLTQGSALGLGSSFVDRGVERTFDIFPVKGKPKSVPSLENAFNPFKFRRPKGKTKLPRQAFVERSAFAIDTPEELAGITFKGLIERERRRGVRNILRVPRKRKRKVKRRRK